MKWGALLLALATAANAQFLGAPSLYPRAIADTVPDTSLAIVQLPPFSSGTTAKIRAMTGRELSAWLRESGGDSLPMYLRPPVWSSGTSYSQNQTVLWNNYLCVSSVSGTGTNTGNTPAAPPGNSYWGCYANIGKVYEYQFNNFVWP